MMRGAARLLLLRPFVWGVSAQMVASLSSFATTAIVLHASGVGTFGRFTVCLLLVLAVRNVLGDVLLTPMSTLAPKLRGATLPAYRGFLLAASIVFALGTSALLGFGAMLVGAGAGLPWLAAAAVPIALATAASVLADAVRRWLIVSDRAAFSFAVEVVRYAVQLALLVVLAEGIETALLAVALGGFVGAALGAIAMGRPRWSPRLCRSIWPRHEAFLRWMAPGAVLDAVQANAPYLIGAAFLGEQALGVARAVQQLANALNLPVNALAQLAPAVAARRLVERGDPGLDQFLRGLAVAAPVGAVALYLAAVPMLDLAFASILSMPAEPLLFTLFAALNLLLALRLAPMVLHQVHERPDILFRANLHGGLVAVAAPAVLAPLGAAAIPLAFIAATGGTTVVLLFARQRLQPVGAPA